MAHYLITGGAGFVGSHSAEMLLANDHRVTVLDDLSTGSEGNLAHFAGDSRFRFVQGSVMDGALLSELIDECDLVYHLAATVGVFNILDRPVQTITNNVAGTEKVLEAAVHKRRKVIVASTSEVYGKTNALQFQEEGDLVLGPSSKSRWSYAASKLVDEFLALAYWKEYRVPTVVVRLFNTVGPRQSGQYGMVVPRFIDQALKGRNLTVYGTGTQSRCFTYVSDVAEWLYRLSQMDSAVGEVLNLGNPMEITIDDLARKVIQMTGSSSGVEYVPYESAYESGFEDMLRRVPDISKVTGLTGYHPQVSLDEALRLTRDWFLREPVSRELVVEHVA